MKKKIIAGNWKMNKTPSEAVALINELKPLVQNEDVDVVFCVPAISIVPDMEADKTEVSYRSRQCGSRPFPGPSCAAASSPRPVSHQFPV